MQSIELLTSEMQDYSLIDSGGCERLEKFGKIIVRKPDPQAIWKKQTRRWDEANLIFHRDNSGFWERKGNIPERWTVTWKNLSFVVRPTPFKHLGIFPEQAAHWDWIQQKIKTAKASEAKSRRTSEAKSRRTSEAKSRRTSEASERKLKVLNLFAYTGAMSIVCAYEGCDITHVDASKSAIEWTKENAKLNNLEGKIRVINDDCLKFCEREIKRGNHYDIIIADPPIFGHGVDNELWKFNDNFPELMEKINILLSNDPVCVLINAYAISSSSLMLANVFSDFFPTGKIASGELAIKEETGRLFSTGLFSRWEK